jgi:HSP20 family protein
MSLTLFSTNGRATHGDPFALARELLRFDPFIPSVRGKAAGAAELSPAFDVKESEDAYTIQADLPGVKEDALELTLDGEVLTISGSRTAEDKQQTDNYHVWERRTGSFRRSFTLPREVDGASVSAKLDSGVLTVKLPKKPESKARKIPLK